MRTTALALAAAFLLFGAMLCAQYPKDEKIQPYPAPIIDRTLHKRFLCDQEGATEWKALHQALLVPLGESLQVESNGHDPYVMLPPIETPKAGTFEFRVRMKNNMNPSAEIFWATAREPNFQAKNAVRFDFLPDGDWHTYAVEFATDSPLTSLRFDPGTSAGIAEIAWVELYEAIRGDVPENPTPWYDAKWIENLGKDFPEDERHDLWLTMRTAKIRIDFAHDGTGAVVFMDDKAVGEIYPLVYRNPDLPLGGVKHIPFHREEAPVADKTGIIKAEGYGFSWRDVPDGFGMLVAWLAGIQPGGELEYFLPSGGTLSFELRNDELRFELETDEPLFGPVFRPYGEMQQAVLNGVEYLEKGEHSSSTADIETKEHLRFAPSPMDITWQFMSVVTDHAAFGLVWDDPLAQPIFAVPDIIFGDPGKHHMGLHGKELAGTLKILRTEPVTSVRESEPVTLVRNSPATAAGSVNTPLDDLILWAFQKRGGAPDIPKRLRNDEEQRLLNLAAFYESGIVGADGSGWRHAALPGVDNQNFPAMLGSDFITAVWQLTGQLLTGSPPNLGHNGGAHLPNPASFFLLGQADVFRVWKRNESVKIRGEQRPDGSFPYSGKYLKGHWEDTASGHCGNKLYRLLYTYQILGEPEALAAALKGLEFANKYTVPRGAQVWELSLHTPDIMGSSRMCMANVWAYEATGDEKYLAHARRWAITGLPFVYLWENKPMGGKEDPIMLYATTPVFGATDWVAPNWIGLPVQWCGLDYAEACFMLAKHDLAGTPVDWHKIGEGILTTAERMQYPEGPSIGLLPDAYKLETQVPLPYDINPSVLVQQRRWLQGKLPALDIALSADKQYRVVSPYKTTIEGNVAVIEGAAGTTYQIIVNGEKVKTIESQGVDRVGLAD